MSSMALTALNGVMKSQSSNMSDDLREQFSTAMHEPVPMQCQCSRLLSCLEACFAIGRLNVKRSRSQAQLTRVRERCRSLLMKDEIDLTPNLANRRERAHMCHTLALITNIVH